MGEERTSSAVGTWHWLLQRITGLSLLYFLGVHMFVTHFGGFYILTFAEVAKRFRSSPGFWLWFDGLFLLVGLFHGLNGIRTIIYDFRPSRSLRSRINMALWVIGVIAAVAGFIILVPYVRAGG